MAYWTGMRQKEILQIEWKAINLKEGFLHLRASQTKTNEARTVWLFPQVIQMLKEIPRTLHTRNVFLTVTQKPNPRWAS